ncbi:MAG: type II toxin-antitoxin system VapC family toxin [Rhizobiaceae bacterium]|nr:type II toxin-antitoxin system VapC family toxin [Rhizobiaceae bacterium]
MIGLDTNILLRLVLQDDPEESPKARALIESLDVDNPGFINTLVLAEFVWTLRGRIGLTRERTTAAVSGLLNSADIVFEQEELVEHALDVAVQSKADFADLMIAIRNEAAGCTKTMSFDRSACKKIASMELLS